MPATAYLRLEGPGAPCFASERGPGDLALEHAVRLDGRAAGPVSVEVEPRRVRADLGPLGTIEDLLEPGARGETVAVRRRWSLRARGALRVRFAVDAPLRPVRWLVPAVMYDGNRLGAGAFPAGGPERGWTFREDRCALPSATVVADDRRSLALATEAAASERFLSAVSTRAHAGGVRLAVEVPWAERPFSYRRKLYLGAPGSAPRAGRLAVEGAFDYERRFFLRAGPPGPCFHAPFVREALAALPAARPARHAWGEIVRAKAEHVLANHLIDDGTACGFVTYADRHGIPLLNSIQGGFLGRGAELALALYRIGAETADAPLRGIARRAADFLLGGRLPSGLLYTERQLAARRWVGLSFPRREGVVNPRTMGETAEGLLRLADAAEPLGEANPEWAGAAEGLARFFGERLPPDGDPGRWWTAAGERVEAGTTNGAYLVPVLLRVAARTGEGRPIETAVRIGEHFLRAATGPGVFFGDTLDADCVDKEAGHAVLRAMLALHRATGEARFLEGALGAAAFVATWVYGYDVPYGRRTPLGRRGFRTTGGTAVSVAHHHLDPYGIAIAADLLDLAAAAGDPFWGGLAGHLIEYAGQLVATPADPLGYPRRFAGHQPEQVNHTDWSYHDPAWFPRGSFISNILWVPSLTLGAALDLRARHPDTLDFALQPVRRRPPLGPLARAARAVAMRLNVFV